MSGNIIQLTPINGISAQAKLFSARKTQKIISNLLKIDAKQATGIDPGME
jgi:hypothetical protein